jgi:PAS domain S-box-containing protein
MTLPTDSSPLDPAVPASPVTSLDLATLHAVVQESSDCIKLLDLGARLLSMNAGGMSVMEIDDFSVCQNLLWPEFWEGEGRAQVEAALDRARAGERSAFEGQANTFGGSPRWWDVRVAPIFGESGQVKQLLAVSRDITVRKLAEQQILDLNGSLAQQVQQRTQQLDGERAALAAFAAFTEGVGSETDLHKLADQAINVLITAFPDAVATVHTPEGEGWTVIAWNPLLDPATLSRLKQGLPASHPVAAQVLLERQAVFLDHWAALPGDPGSGGPVPPGHERAVAAVPLLVSGEVEGVLSIGLPGARSWQPHDQAVVRAVGRGLTLALERSVQARQLQEANAELFARTKALESFAALRWDSGEAQGRLALIERAQAVVLSVLADGFATYYEPDPQGERWGLRAQTGRADNPALQAVLESGLDWSRTRNLLEPWTTRQPFYQEAYDPETDGVGEVIEKRGATACLPLLVAGEPTGVFTVALFEGRRWTRADQAVLEGVTRILGTELERSATQEVLNRTQRYLQVVADHAPLALFAIDRQGIFTLSEGRLLAKLGLTPGQAVGRVATEMYRHEPDLRGGSRIERALGGEAVHDLARFGSLGLTLESWFVPVHNAAGEVSEVVGVALDVTERLETQRSLERSNAELKSANAELEAFAYTASHDLRTPVRHVQSFAELARKALKLTPESPALRYLGFVEQAAVRMSTLIDAMLLLSRSTSQALSAVPVALDELLERAVRDIDPELADSKPSGRQIEWRLAPLPEVVGDPVLLQQVFNNLLANAVKFTRTRPVALIEVWAEEHSATWTVFVRDNGVGFGASYASKLFTVFQRLHLESEFEGTGVGLATVRRIVLRHGGSVHASGEVEQGATFSFTLPRPGPTRTGSTTSP